MTQQSMEDFRNKIDAIDRKILNLLGERVTIIHEVAKFKKVHCIDPLDETRVQEVIKLVRDQAKQLHISDELVEKIYTLIIENAIAIERAEKQRK